MVNKKQSRKDKNNETSIQNYPEYKDTFSSTDRTMSIQQNDYNTAIEPNQCMMPGYAKS